MDINFIKNNINHLFQEHSELITYNKKDLLRKKILSYYTNPKHKQNPTSEDFIECLYMLEQQLFSNDLTDNISQEIAAISKKLLGGNKHSSLHFEMIKLLLKGAKKTILTHMSSQASHQTKEQLNDFIFNQIIPFTSMIFEIKEANLNDFSFLKDNSTFEDKKHYFNTILLNLQEDYCFKYNIQDKTITIKDNFKFTDQHVQLDIEINVPFKIETLYLFLFDNTKHTAQINNAINLYKSDLENELFIHIHNELEDYINVVKNIRLQQYELPINSINYSGINDDNLFNTINQIIQTQCLLLTDLYNNIFFKNNIKKCSYADMFPLARNKTRKFKFFLGETGSGKTYNAFQQLKGKESGLFLAPLRLLALEGQETIEKLGIPCNLITGEEQDIKENATFCASTIEMLDLNKEYSIVIIDECQLIFDVDRGWAWTQAIVGANASEIVLTGSQEALNAIQFLTQYTQDEIEIIQLKKMTTLEKYPQQVSRMKDIPENTAIVCFSKKRIIELKNTFEKETRQQASVIFGALSPEIRKEEARRFRDGETKVVFATDAIGLGLNLPIKYVLFDKIEKFDGQECGTITSSLAKQIVGRAGRFGFFNTGYYGVFNNGHIEALSNLLNENYPKHANLFYYKIPFTVFQEISNLINTKNCFEILNKFINLYDLIEPNFIKMDYTELLYKASIIEKHISQNLSTTNLYQKYKLIFSPIDIGNEDMKSFFNYLIKEKISKLNDFDFEKDLKSHITSVKTMEDLNLVEYKMSILDAYNWLSFNFGHIFVINKNIIKNERNYLNELVLFFLKEKGQLYKKCSTCDTNIPEGQYLYCNPCFTLCKKKNSNNKIR